MILVKRRVERGRALGGGDHVGVLKGGGPWEQGGVVITGGGPWEQGGVVITVVVTRGGPWEQGG